ncbi:MAG: TonB family protein [Candidatus Sulfotelmatobacter sp.]
MGYQALLFCPDEKTARTVTQVLSELDFAVIPCTEPFAAVKKLMGERFDAVVVDCDNEQNATLLFKSARNAANNQSSLAVAVVEGQAGVAKAFRIGANLVLTKPINVEQAKGTLRVARGLLRKNETGKPTSSATPAMNPAAAAPEKPAHAIPRITDTRPPARVAPRMVPPASIPIQKPAQQPSVVASAPIEIAAEKIKALPDASDYIAQPAATSAQPSAPKAAASLASSVTAERKSSPGFAASAPAPARQSKSGASLGDKPSILIAEPANQFVKTDLNEKNSSITEASAPAAALTFGGAVAGGKEPASKGSNKKLFIAVAVVLFAVGSYAARMHWARSNETETAPVPIAAQPAKIPSQQLTPTPAPATTSSSSDIQAPAIAAKVQTHPSKAIAVPESSKPSAPVTLAESKPAATDSDSQPMVIKGNHAKAAAKAVTDDAPALSVTDIAPDGNVAALPNLMGSNNAPTPVLQRLMVSQGVSRGLLVKQVQPIYPRSAMQLHIEGSVQLMASLSKNGNITEVRILSGDTQLARAAVDAVKQWKYKPYLLNGEPVDIQTQITVNFKLPH